MHAKYLANNLNARVKFDIILPIKINCLYELYMLVDNYIEVIVI